MVDLFVDLELRVILEVLVDGGLGVVARSPGAVGEQVRGHVFDDGVEDDAVAAGGDQRGVGLEFGEDVGWWLESRQTRIRWWPAALACTCAMISGAMAEPWIMSMRLAMGWASMAALKTRKWPSPS